MRERNAIGSEMHSTSREEIARYEAGSSPTIWPASPARPRGTSRRPRGQDHGARREHDVHRVPVFEPMRDPPPSGSVRGESSFSLP